MSSAQDKTPPPLPPLGDRLVGGIVKPGFLVTVAYFHHIVTFFRGPLLPFRDLTAFRHKAFARVWATVGPIMSQNVHGDIPSRLASASGVVLDVGPGTGEMLSRMDASRVTVAYGVEPAVDMHAALRANVERLGFGGGKYVVLGCGAEPGSLVPALHGCGLLGEGRGEDGGVFDTVLCVRVLCGVPCLQETVDELYRLLKPGGRMIVYEHVASPFPAAGSTRLGWLLQGFWWLAGWNVMMGGCEINRDTVSVLKRAGGEGGKGWRKIDLKYWDKWNAVPFVVGELVKA